MALSIIPQTREISSLTATSFLPPGTTLQRSRSFSSLCKKNNSADSLSLRSTTFKVMAGVGLYPASISWWKKGSNVSNMHDITSRDQFFEAISRAASQNKLVLVDFYGTGCPSCKAIFPKICQIARDNPNIEILKVNFYDNDALCRSLKVTMLPFFHLYRDVEGPIASFSCSLTKINKLREAVKKYQVHQQVPSSIGSTTPSYQLQN